MHAHSHQNRSCNFICNDDFNQPALCDYWHSKLNRSDQRQPRERSSECASINSNSNSNHFHAKNIRWKSGGIKLAKRDDNVAALLLLFEDGSSCRSQLRLTWLFSPQSAEKSIQSKHNRAGLSKFSRIIRFPELSLAGLLDSRRQ